MMDKSDTGGHQMKARQLPAYANQRHNEKLDLMPIQVTANADVINRNDSVVSPVDIF